MCGFVSNFEPRDDCQPWHITNAAKGNASFVSDVWNDHGQLLYLKNELGTYATCHNKTRRLCEGSLHFQPRNAPFRGRVIEFNGSTLVYFVFVFQDMEVS